MTISTAIQLAIAHQAGNADAYQKLTSEYTADSVDRYLAEVDRLDRELPDDPEGLSLDQVRDHESDIGIAAMTLLDADTTKAIKHYMTELDFWRHVTPHHRYSCDGGCLAIRINGSVTATFQNHYGDGTFPVYVRRNFACGRQAESFPTTFEWGGTHIGHCTIEVLNYDGTSSNDYPVETMAKIEVNSAMIYHGFTGAMVICIED